MSTKQAPKDEEVVKEEIAIPVVEEVSLEAYLKGVDASETLKGMFSHYTRKTGGPEKGTKEALDATFEAFKSLTVNEL